MFKMLEHFMRSYQLLFPVLYNYHSKTVTVKNLYYGVFVSFA